VTDFSLLHADEVGLTFHACSVKACYRDNRQKCVWLANLCACSADYKVTTARRRDESVVSAPSLKLFSLTICFSVDVNMIAHARTVVLSLMKFCTKMYFDNL